MNNKIQEITVNLREFIRLMMQKISIWLRQTSEKSGSHRPATSALRSSSVLHSFCVLMAPVSTCFLHPSRIHTFKLSDPITTPKNRKLSTPGTKPPTCTRSSSSINCWSFRKRKKYKTLAVSLDLRHHQNLTCWIWGG